MQPFRAGGGFDPEAQIAAVSRQVQRKFRLVAGIGAESGIAPVEGAIEKLAAVLDHKILAVRRVAERPADVVHQVWLRSLPDGGARRGERYDQ
jgi:hypothetical protein